MIPRAALALLGAATMLVTTPVAAPGPASASASALASATVTAPVRCSHGLLKPHTQGPVRFTTTLDGTTARLTASVAAQHREHWLRHPHLTLTRGADSWRVALRPAPLAFQHRYVPVALIVDASHLSGYVCLVRFRPNAAPVAVTSVYAGGAHCCTTVRAFALSGRRQSHLDTGNRGATVLRLGHRALLHTGDDAFSYEFTAFAFSADPLRLLRASAGTLADVTRAHPRQIRADARSWWRVFAHADDGRGVIAAWAADQEMLGRDNYVRSTLHRLEHDKRLAAQSSSDPEFGWPGGAKYLDKLRRFLRTQGYLR